MGDGVEHGTPTGEPGSLRGAVVRACAALAARLSLPAADAVAAVGRRVADTPSLVVTGPVSSGKSTLVNALVGRRVAPTGAGECTRLVARYVRGPVDRLDVVLVDGTRRPLPLAPGGRVPAAVGDRLGVDPDDVDHLVVTLTSGALDGLTVVDTPGTGSAREAGRRARGHTDGTRGRTAPGTLDPIASTPATTADAALVVLPATAQPADVDALGGGAAGDGPTGVVAVLGRADTVGDDDGVAVAEALGRRLGDRLGPVSPVIGLLAETAVTGALRTEDVRALAALAALTGKVRDALDVALLDPELFVTADLPVPAATRSGLLELLDRRGVALAVARLRAEPDAGVGELCELLLAASGLDHLVARLAREVRARTDLLAARTGVRHLEVLAETWTRPHDPDRGERRVEAARIRDVAADLRKRPDFEEAALLAVRARLRSGALCVPEELVTEVDRLAAPGAADRRLGQEGAPAMELAAHAARRAAWWRSYAGWGTSRRAADAAHVVHRAYLRSWRELTGR